MRFVCYDLSAVEQPGSSNKGASSNQDTLLDVLAQLVGRQKALVESCTPTQRAPALSALVAALRAESASQQTARTKRAAGWCADAFEALLSDGTLLYESRLSELLGSLLRYHLHVIFDRPSRNALRAEAEAEAEAVTEAEAVLPLQLRPQPNNKHLRRPPPPLHHHLTAIKRA